jgi:multidrug efflux pump subunit AcrB
MILWAAKRPAVIWAAALMLVLAGGVSFTRLPLATKTVVELPQLTVQALWPGAASELLEMYITSPVEEAIQGVRGVRKTESESSDRTGSRITVFLDPQADVQMVRLGILERLEILRREFPPGVTQPSVNNYVPRELAEEVLLRYTLAGPYTPGTMQQVARDQITPRLSAIIGVAGVNSMGGATTGIAVSYDASRLRQLGIPPERIGEALSASRRVQALGEQLQGVGKIPVILRDQPHEYRDLEELPVRGPGNRVFRLGEIASVRLQEDARGSFYRFNGETSVVLEITRLPGADAIKTAATVREEIARLEAQLPTGIRFHLRSDESVALGRQLDDLTKRGAIAFVAVLLVLALTLRNRRSVMLVMVSAAVAISGTALGLYLLDIPANLLTLAGLGMGIGILVQNGLIVVERLRHEPDTVEGRATAGRQITPAVVGATLTTAIVLFPFMYLQGNTRAAFMPFAAAFALALFWSVIASVVMLPALGAGHGLPARGWPRLVRGYSRVASRLIRWRVVILILTTATLGVLTWGFIKKVPRTSFGNFGGAQTTLSVQLFFPRGSDPEAVDHGMREFERLAVGQLGVESVQTSGSISGGQMRVIFTDEAAMTAIPLAMQEEMTQRAIVVGGARVTVSGQGPGFYSGGGGSGASARIKLLGYSFNGVEELAKDLQRRLEVIPRVRDVNINAGSFFGSERTIFVTLVPDRAAMARYGVTSAMLAQSVSREVSGGTGGTRVDFDGEEILVTLKVAGVQERALDDLRNAVVPTPNQAPVRIRDLATVGEREGLASISREDQQYVRIVAYDFRGPPRLQQRIHKAFMESISVPPGYTVGDQVFTWGSDDSQKGLWLVFGAGVILVILAVAMVFDSTWAAAMVFLSLPLALAGVVAIFWATGSAFSREAAVGVILVVGLAVNQSILLVDGALTRRRRRAGVDPEGRPTRILGPLTATDVLYAARNRCGMITLVTLTTLASLLPLAIGTKSTDIFGSIALATVGGTLAGTFGALFILPALLAAGHRHGKRRGPRGGAKAPGWWTRWRRRGAPPGAPVVSGDEAPAPAV